DLDSYSIFTDVAADHPTQQVEPASATVTDFAETGLEFTATGLAAGDERDVVVISLTEQEGEEPLFFPGTVAEDGTLTVQLQGELAEGDYFAAAFVNEGIVPVLDAIGYFVATAPTFEITADPADGGAEGDNGAEGENGTDDDAAT